MKRIAIVLLTVAMAALLVASTPPHIGARR
jgi:hypothetical protein